MTKNGQKAGFTLLETICVMVIIATLSALTYPAMVGAVRSAKTTSAMANLKQLHVAIALYRTEYDGDGRYGTASEMGLPEMLWQTTIERYFQKTFPGTDLSWCSPCGQHMSTSDCSATGTNLWFHPTDIPDEPWPNYARKWQESAVVMSDANCNELTIPLKARGVMFRFIGLRLDGSVVTRFGDDSKSGFSIWE